MRVGGPRHAARELALKMLFQVDIGRVPVADVLANFAPDEEIGEPPAESIVFAHNLVRGTAQNLREIDRILSSLTEEWTYDRLASVDRNILRLAVYELLHSENVPEEVVINEAVELAKEYSTEESGKFVNGILGNLSRQRAAGTLPAELKDEETAPVLSVATEEAGAEIAEEPEPSASPTPDAPPAKRKRQPLRLTTEE